MGANLAKAKRGVILRVTREIESLATELLGIRPIFVQLVRACSASGSKQTGSSSRSTRAERHIRRTSNPARPSRVAGDRAQSRCHETFRLSFCCMTGVHETPSPIDLSSLANRYNVSSPVVEDLYARRRAGARDAELINLLQQMDRGGLDTERAQALVAELPER